MSERSVWVPSVGGAPLVALPVARALADRTHASLHVTDADPDAMARGAESVIVTSTRDARDPPRVALGLAARGVLSRARCPVVLVRPERGTGPWSLDELLVPHDGTPATTAALCPAAELARSIGARLFALHVAAPGAPRHEEPGSLQVPHYVDQPQHEWPAWAGEFVERLRSQCPIDLAQVRFFLGHGEPATEILRIAEEQGVDLIVLAWHGTLEAEHARIFKTLLHRAPCPMMVLRVDAEAPRSR